MKKKKKKKEVKKLRNMKVTVIPIVIGGIEPIPKGFVREPEELEIGKQAETI